MNEPVSNQAQQAMSIGSATNGPKGEITGGVLGQQRQPVIEALRFGNGRLVVDTGQYEGHPAVFIAPVSEPGEVGTSAAHLGHPLDCLQPGEIVMTFPTEEQARRVADALCNAGPVSP